MHLKLKRLASELAYTFKNPDYLQQALTHRSAGINNNERFEFLGDSLLNCVITQALFKQFPDKHEGELSRMRAFLVKGENLADIAANLNLGDYLILGQGELKTGGFRRGSILADALEAMFAAIFLDSDFESCQNTILHLFHNQLNSQQWQHKIMDAKTKLQEHLQAQKQALPEYKLTATTGEEHEQSFTIECTLPGLNLQATGQGESRRKAEQDAAAKLLALLGVI